jgi:hypothetical protein
MIKKLPLFLFFLLIGIITLEAKKISSDWTKDEIILLMDTYIRIRPNYDSENKEIKALSDLYRKNNKELSKNSSYRNVNSVYFNLKSLQTLDEKNNKKIRGVIKASNLQKEVWNTYSKDEKKLKDDSKRIKEIIENK